MIGKLGHLAPRSRIGRITLSAAATAIVAMTTLGLVGAPTVAAATTGIFPDSMTPQVSADSDRDAVELGIRFSPQQAGQVTALQYYQSRAATGVTTATLWASSGAVLARANFTASTTVGWRTVALGAPVSLAAGSTYVASYFAPNGGYPVTEGDLLTDKAQNGFSLKAGAGVYRYGSPGGMPSQSYKGSNYLVDIVYSVGGAGVSTTTSKQPTTTAAPTTTSKQPTTTAAPTTSRQSTSTAPTTTAPSPAGGFVALGRSFPSDKTTGVPAGTTLAPYTGPCTIQTANVTIDAKLVNCDLRILAKGVTINRSQINGSVYTDADANNGSFTLTDSWVNMPLKAGTGIGDANFVATRVHVTGGSRSVNCYRDCTIQDSYVHGQYKDVRGIDHESGIRMGSNSVIRHNTIACDAPDVPPDAGCSAALTGYGDFAIVQKNTIDNNLIVAGSGGYCAYGGSTAGKPYSAGVNNIKFTNNVWQRGTEMGDGGRGYVCGWWGPITSFDSKAPGNEWTNNLYDDGTPVPPAN